MLKQKINKFVLFIVSVFIFLSTFFHCSPAQADDSEYIEIYEDTIWHKNDNLTFNKMIYVYSGATLTIEKGAEVKFGKINEMGDDAFLSMEGGRLVAEGTQDEPIKITSTSQSDYHLVEFHYGYEEGASEVEPSFLRYAEISKGGYGWGNSCPDCSGFWRNLIPSVFAFDDGLPAVYFEGGRVHMENCRFSENEYADVGVEYWENEENSGSYLEIVNSNFEKNNNEMAVKSEMHCQNPGLDCMKKVFLKNNWYGDVSGPSGEAFNYDPEGKEISGVFYLDSWRINNLIADPVLIIPGIMGSAEVTNVSENSQLVLDPILHIYDNLTASFKKNGYKKDVNFFEFPYEWRNSNVLTADALKNKIKNIGDNTRVSKVDLVAHSMGGLISRYYIENPAYQNDVDQLITLGTPHKGSPKIYLSWESGEIGIKFEDKIIKKLFQLEALHSGFFNLKEYIQIRIKSVEELLPDYDYLFDVQMNKTREYPDNYPQNIFMDYLNSEDRIENLNKVDLYNIYGKVSSESTISKFRVVDSIKDDLWEHGMPENFYNVGTNQGIEYDKGDETVPMESAKGIQADKVEEIDSIHSDLPTKAQCYVISELTGMDRENDCEYVSTFDRIKNILTFGVFSPIDIQVIAPDGKKVGKDFETGNVINEIDGAYYTGYNAENEFLTIPNPIDGEYKILAQGTGEGKYRIEVARISEEENDPGGAIESTVEITGMAEPEKLEELQVEVSGNEVIGAPGDTVPPKITAQIFPDPNENGWHSTDVTVHFEASDESGIKSITPDAVLSDEGENQSIIGEAEDNFGNKASLTVENINIDKTAPTVAILSPENKTYKNNKILKIKYEVSDSLTSKDEIQVEIFLDGQPFGENKIDLSLLRLGSHKLTIDAEDEAGNRSEDNQAAFEITTDINSIISNVKHYYDLGFITKRSTKNYLEVKLKNLKRVMSLLEVFENRWMPKWAKNKAVANLEKNINRQIANLIQKIEKQPLAKSMDEKVRELLVESLENMEL